jgi:ABC-type branched-subunit amino acid transport system ATPase component/branched-subunit amino acid ABC-type transport system permease component
VTEFLQFAVLGIGAGAVYALLAEGIVLTYRGSGIVNFAQGSMAMVAAFFFWQMHWQDHWPTAVAFPIAVIIGAALGVAIFLIIMRPLAKSAALVRVVATLGVVTVLTAAASLHWGDGQQIVDSSLPIDRWKLGGVAITSDRIYLLVISIVVTAAAWLAYNRTRFGMAVRAAAEDERGAAALGWSPNFLAVVNWAAGGALAGVAGVLVVPITGLQVDALAVIVIAAMASALLGAFTSFWMTLVGGLVIGIAQSEVTHYVTWIGAADAVPFLFIVAVLVVRGRALPLRSHVLEHLPKLGPDRLPAYVLAFPVVLGVLALTVFSDSLNAAVSTSLIWAVILLSVVVLSGFAGQVSLAQLALAGMGALVAGQLVQSAGLPFEIAIIVGMVSSMLTGLVFAIPALRTRGVNLAVVTLALGLVLESVVFNNPTYTGGVNGITIGTTKFFGIDITRLNHPGRYDVFVLIWAVVLTAVVLNIRRGRSGRRLIGVRTNERAAASLGINVLGAKLYAFGVSAGIAGIGGILLGFYNGTMIFDPFSPIGSINAVVLAVLGGVGYAMGAVSGSTLAAGGLGAFIINKVLHISVDWITLIGGLILLVQLVFLPDGIAAQKLRRPGRKKLPGAKPSARHDLEGGAYDPPSPTELQVQGACVTLGATRALTDVHLTVRTGEIVGLVGPNGAGKTTLIDTVTGFVRPSSGAITLNGERVDRCSPARRARSGVSRSFQSLELFEDLTVWDNIMAGADSHALLPYLTDIVWPRQEKLPPTAVRAIREFDLEKDLDKTVSELPYGRRRIVSIARSLASRPTILLLDEPAAGLSDAETSELGKLLRRLAKEWGIGILLVEHDMSLIMAVCDCLVVLDLGQVIGSGEPAEIRNNDQVRAAYLGTVA